MLTDNSSLVYWKRECHKWFDRLWKYTGNPQSSRNYWYKWLSEQLKVKEAHIADFDIATCKKVIALVKPMIRKGKNANGRHSCSAK